MQAFQGAELRFVVGLLLFCCGSVVDRSEDCQNCRSLAGFTHEALFQTAREGREGGSGINFPPGQRPPEGHGHHMLPYAELLQHARQEEAPQHQV